MLEIKDVTGSLNATIYKRKPGDFWAANDWQVARVAIDKLTIPDEDKRLWKINGDHVAKLAESIKAEGKCIVPIGVQWVARDHKAISEAKSPAGFRLIYGKHRVQALFLLHEEWCKENPGVEPQKSPWLDTQAIAFSPEMTEKDMLRYEAIENLQRRQMTNEEKTALAAVLAGKKLGNLGKSLAIVQETAKQVANVPKEAESGFMEKSIKPKARAEQNKTRASKPVTQATIAEAAGVHLTTVLAAFKTVEAVTGVKIDLGKPETIKAAQDNLNAVMVIAGEDDEFAEQIRDELNGVEKKARAEKHASAGRIQSVINKAEKQGRIDLVEEIKTSPDMKLAAVEAAEDMGISVRRCCRIELHAPTSSIVEKLLNSFGREGLSDICQAGLKRLEDLPLEGK